MYTHMYIYIYNRFPPLRIKNLLESNPPKPKL